MNILIPMAGAGARFFEKGYLTHKPLLPLTSRHSRETVPLVVAAVRDLPIDLEREDVNLLFIVRDFHIADGIDQKIEDNTGSCGMVKTKSPGPLEDKD